MNGGERSAVMANGTGQGLLALMLGVGAAGVAAASFYPWWRHGGGGLAMVAGVAMAVALAGAIGLLARMRGGWFTGAVLILGLGLRIAAAGLSTGYRWGGDALSYATLAQAVIDGRGLIAWGVRAHYPPLYPLLLACAGWVTGSISGAAVAINVVADGCASLLLWRIARRVMDERAARWAGSICFLWPGLMVDGGVAQKEGLALALALGAVLAGMRCVEGGRAVTRAAVLGALWGLLALCQPALVTLPLIMLSALAVRSGEWRRAGQACAVALVVAATVMAPWWVRNALLFGQFVPFTTVGGAIFLGPPGEAAVYPAAPGPVGEVAQAGWSMRHALAAIVRDPLAYVGHALTHGTRAVLLDVGAAEQFFWFSPVDRPGLLVALMTACQLCWAALWLAAALSLRRAPAMVKVLLVGAAVQFVGVNLWLQFQERHRLILMPLLLLVALASSRRGASLRGDRERAR